MTLSMYLIINFYFVQILPPLNTYEYTIVNTLEFVNEIR